MRLYFQLHLHWQLYFIKSLSTAAHSSWLMGRIGTGLLAAAAVIAVLNKILGLREERLVKRPLVVRFPSRLHLHAMVCVSQGA